MRKGVWENDIDLEGHGSRIEEGWMEEEKMFEESGYFPKRLKKGCVAC
jgi:hypothetical protein